MSNSHRKLSHSQSIIGGVVVIYLLWVSGCGDFFAQKPVELQTQKILNEIRQIKENPNIKNPLPEMYRGPAKRIKVKDGIKLFYFTKNHTVDKLSGLITQQLGNKVSLNSPTNQLIIHCPNEEDADKVIEFLNMIDVPPIQVNIDCLILERFADVTMDWETTILIENLFGERITLGGKTDATGKLLPAFPGASLRAAKRAEFGLDIGYWRNQGVLGHQFRAVVDMLISRGYLKILMNPALETVNGQKAKILLKDFAPLEMIVTKEGVDPYSLTEYRWVEDSLEVTPNVFADGSIGLATMIKLSSRSKPEGVVQTSIITERSIDVAENRIKPGDSLVIGGIRKSEERAVIRGVPFLKDIPLLGILFSSKDFEEKATEVIFILTPSISSGGIEYAKMIEDVKKKYAPPKYEVGLGEVLTDPFGAGIYTEYVEQQAARAEFERLKSEIEKAQATEEMDIVKVKLFEIADQLLAEKSKTAKARAQVRAAREEMQKAKTEAEKLAGEAEKAKADAQKAIAEAEKAKEDAEKVKAEAEKAEEQADKKTKPEEVESEKAEYNAQDKGDIQTTDNLSHP